MFDRSLPYVLLTIKYEIDPAFHIKTYIYRTRTSEGNYVIHVEEYLENIFVLKFYPVRFKRYQNKYHMISNDYVMQDVIGTSLQVLLSMFNTHQNASFGFVATASVIGIFSEAKSNNQRFRIYKQVMQNFFGHETFLHFLDVENSAYLMANKAIKDVNDFIARMQVRFSDLYPDMFGLHFTQM